MTAFGRALRILVTDAEQFAGLGAVRSLGRAGHFVVAGYPQGMMRAAALATFSNSCGVTVTYPDPWEHQLQFRQWLVDELSRDTYDAFLPSTEAAIVAAQACREELAGRAQLLLPSDEHLRYTLSKFQATRVALEVGLAAPKTIFLLESGEPTGGSAGLTSLRFPIVIKFDNYLREDGTYVKGSARCASTLSQAMAFLEEGREARTSVIAQEMIEGHGVGAFLLRRGGRSLLRFAHTRIHEVPYTGGMSTLRASSRDDTVIAAAEKLLAAIEYDGIAMVEFRQHGRGSTPYFLEINGRLWQSIALAQHAGVDFPLAWLESQLSGTTAVSQPSYPAGQRCRQTVPGELHYVRSVLAANKHTADHAPPSKAYTLLEFVLLSLDPRVRSDTLWLSDPMPWLVTFYATGVDILARGLRNARKRVRSIAKRSLLQHARDRQQQSARRGAYFAQPMSNILFVCQGNVCRSAFAEHYWNECIRKRWPSAPVAFSAGFLKEENRRSPPHWTAAARRREIELALHRSRLISRGLVQEAEAIFVMDLDNYLDLTSLFPEVINKTYFLGLFDGCGSTEVRDPYALAAPDAIKSCDQLVRALDSLSEAMPLREAVEAGRSA